MRDNILPVAVRIIRRLRPNDARIYHRATLVCILRYYVGIRGYVLSYINYIVITDNDINGRGDGEVLYTADVTSWSLPRSRRAPVRLSCFAVGVVPALISLGNRPEKSSQTRRRCVVDDINIGIDV